ncbi:unnamed protein product, partial [Oppiella nova]
ESILNEKEKQLIRLKIEENRRKRKLSEETMKVTLDSWGNSSPDSGIFMGTDTMDHNSVDTYRSNSISDSERDIKEVIQRCIKYEDQLNSISEDVYETAVELEFSLLPIARPLTDYRNNFNELEGYKLTELFSAISLIREPTTAKRVVEVVVYPQQMMGNLAARFEREIKKVVYFIKNLTGFRDVCENDQIALVKYGAIEVLNMRSIVYFNREKDRFECPISDESKVIMKLDVMKQQVTPIYMAYKSYFDHMCPEWDSDPVIIDLLSAILMFNPNRPGLTHKDVVKFQQKTYMYLLQRYLLLRYRSECESKSKFLRLINILKDVHMTARCTRQEGKNNGDRNRPFLKELFEETHDSAEDVVNDNITDDTTTLPAHQSDIPLR